MAGQEATQLLPRRKAKAPLDDEHEMHSDAPPPEHVPQLASQLLHTDEALAYLEAGVQSERQLDPSTPSKLRKGKAIEHEAGRRPEQRIRALRH